MVNKADVRQRGRERRAALGEAARFEFDARIVARCWKELDWEQYTSVMVFLPLEHQHEVDTWPLVRWVWGQWPNIRVYVPRVRGDDMEAVRITDDTAFAPGAYGVPEPVGGAVLGPKGRMDLVLTPLLGFDLKGRRVGYGRGYFDRFFGDYPAARRVGLGYEVLLVREGILTDDRDVNLQAVVTEERTYEF